jgi:1-acyl-sn-glycerol-3-phosphate acyltransferase
MPIASDAPLLYRFMQRFLWFLLRSLTRLHISGLEHVPAAGPLIISPNHLHVSDVVFVALIPRRITAFAANKWRGKLAGWLLSTAANAIYVARGEVDRQALGRALSVLHRGGALGMAPEGTRSRTGGLLPGKDGPVYLAGRTGAALLPVAVWGQERLFTEWLRLRRPVIHMHIAPPMRLPPAAAHARMDDLRPYTEKLMLAIARLLPAEYRGVYADQVRQG